LANLLLQGVRLARHALKHRLDLLVPITSNTKRRVRWPLLTLRKVLPEPKQPRGVRLRSAFLELGPVYIKLGQLLSTRRDLLPSDLADELSLLQDQVPGIENFCVQDFVNQHLGELANNLRDIEAMPLASASIAQVHTASLVDGAQVVIKIVRPGIAEKIRSDMKNLQRLAQRISDLINGADRLHLPRIIADQTTVLEQELDMFHEARNQIQLRRNFAESDLLYVPRVHAQFTRQNILVMERVYGVPVSHVEELKRQNVDLKLLAHKGVEAFFTQVFDDNFFHADMHPGNVLVDTNDPSNPRYIALDCAIIGTLETADQNYLAHNLLAFFQRDYARVVELHIQSGWVPPDTKTDEFERVIREICEPIFAKPLDEISFGEFIVELFRAAGQFNMEVQPQLVLLQKTLLYIEGLGRQLYPQLDLWETAQPFMERWVAQRVAPANFIQEWVDAGPTIWQQLLRLPSLMQANDTQINLLKSHVHQQSESLKRIEGVLHKQNSSRRYKRVAGISLIGLSTWILWQPIAQGLNNGDLSMLAGVVSAFLGSALLVRA